MVDLNNTGQSDEDLEQIRTVIRSSLEKTDKGGLLTRIIEARTSKKATRRETVMLN